MARPTLKQGARAAGTVCDAITERLYAVARLKLEFERAGNVEMEQQAAREADVLFQLQEAAVHIFSAMERLSK